MKSAYREQKNKRIGALELLNFLTVAYLIFVAPSCFGADLCSKVFLAPEKPISIQDSQELPTSIRIKKSNRLTPDAEELRRRLIEAGVIDTTTGRSEFKHYMEETVADGFLAKLAEEFPPKFSIEGSLLSGLAPRDGMIRLDAQELAALPVMNQEVFGKKVIDVVKEQKLLNALRTPLVFTQNREAIRSRLFRIVGHIRADVLLKQIDELNIRAAASAAESDLVTFTDTSSTSKFSYDNKLSRDAITEQSKLLKLNLSEQILSRLEKVNFSNLDDSQSLLLISALSELGNPRTASENLIENLREAALDEGVIRYRKYRIGRANSPFDQVPAPGFDQRTSNDLIKDGTFADQITWIEFKMKNTSGELTRSTAGNKPRFPLPDSMVYLLKDPARFSSENQFFLTKNLLKLSIRQAVDSLKANNVKEANYNEEQIDLALEFARQLHLQKFSFEPVGRTVNTRQSYNLNLPDKDGKIQNIQITRDHDVWELSRKTGKLVQALPYVAKDLDIHFHYNAETGWYENASHKNLKLIFNPRSPELVYQILNGEQKLVNLKVEPVEVDELKVPLKFIKLSDADIAELPALASIAKLRSDLKDATENLNARRANYDLDPFSIDKGKRSSSRKDIGGGMQLLVHQRELDEPTNTKNLVAVKFKFHPESGYWVAWEHNTSLVYHPSFGVVKLETSGQSRRVLPVRYERP